ncbi:hypothetical protein EDD22DRAFT_849092 [Suillus occidentalis]|nr:hypothetical protein EDD22DRAFT_849092 [Suillus occidentalis]
MYLLHWIGTLSKSPIRKIHTCVYLKVVLKAEFKSQHNPVLKGKTAASCIAEKLYSIKPSSIPEERTMSVFTKMNTPTRNRQQVCTLVEMTQIRQWHMYDPEKFAERWWPDVAFCDIESLISAPTTKSPAEKPGKHELAGSYLSVDTTDGEEEMLEEEYTWLDDMVTDSIPAQDSAFEVEAEVDIHAPIMTRILSDNRESVADEAPVNNGDSSDGPSDLEDADAEWTNCGIMGKLLLTRMEVKVANLETEKVWTTNEGVTMGLLEWLVDSVTVGQPGNSDAEGHCWKIAQQT